jgi:hypothetical protein
MAPKKARVRILAVILHADVVGSTGLVRKDETLVHGPITLAQPAAGEGQVVLLEGEAAIGKSRLTDELRRSVACDSGMAPVKRRVYARSSTGWPMIVLNRAAYFGQTAGLTKRAGRLPCRISRHCVAAPPIALRALSCVTAAI